LSVSRLTLATINAAPKTDNRQNVATSQFT
jgi:hypothetical protein